MFDNIEEGELEDPVWCSTFDPSQQFGAGIIDGCINGGPSAGDIGGSTDKEMPKITDSSFLGEKVRGEYDRKGGDCGPAGIPADDGADSPKYGGDKERGDNGSAYKNEKDIRKGESDFPRDNLLSSVRRHRGAMYGLGGALFFSLMYGSGKVGFSDTVDSSFKRAKESVSWVYEKVDSSIDGIFNISPDELPEEIDSSLKAYKRDILSGKYDSEIRRSIDLLVSSTSIPYKEKELTEGALSVERIRKYLKDLPKDDDAVKGYISDLSRLIDGYRDENMVDRYVNRKFNEAYNGMSDSERSELVMKLISRLSARSKVKAVRWTVERMDYDAREGFLSSSIASLDGKHTRELGSKLVSSDRDYFTSLLVKSCKDDIEEENKADDDQDKGVSTGNAAYAGHELPNDGIISRIYKRITGG